MRKISLFIIILVSAIASSSLKGQIYFNYDDAGNCIEKYKTIVLLSKVKGNSKDTTNVDFQSEKILDRELIIYPNPTRGALKVEIRGKSPENPVRYLLTDLSGKTLSQVKSDDMYYLFDMTAYPTGVYLLRIMIDNRWSKWKIIKE